MSKRARIFPLMLVAGVIAMSAATAGAAEPTFVTFAVDETQFFPFTSAICGFPVYQHDTGTVTTMITTMPDGSVKAHDVIVKITPLWAVHRDRPSRRLRHDELDRAERPRDDSW